MPDFLKDVERNVGISLFNTAYFHIYINISQAVAPTKLNHLLVSAVKRGRVLKMVWAYVRVAGSWSSYLWRRAFS